MQHVNQVLKDFDGYLSKNSLHLDAVVLGGAALNLLGVVARPTRDCDIIHPELSAEMLAAARRFASEQRASGVALDDDWLNNGPASLAAVLPPGWQERTQEAFSGAAVSLRALGRIDLICTKLFAYCDRNIDLDDCLALAPTPAELTEARPWVARQDANPDWPEHVDAMLDDLARRLGHG